jgi:hypothetical protein
MKTNDVDLQEERAIIVLPNIDIEWLEILTHYVNLRKNVDGDRFFLQLRYGKLTKQPYGHNSLSEFPK